MKKQQVSKYKIAKGVGQIAFDLALSGGMYLTGIRFNGRGMIVYQVAKGITYLAWDLIIFERSVEEDKTENNQ